MEPFKAGDEVEAFCVNDGKWYPAVIRRVRSLVYNAVVSHPHRRLPLTCTYVVSWAGGGECTVQPEHVRKRENRSQAVAPAVPKAPQKVDAPKAASEKKAEAVPPRPPSASELFMAGLAVPRLVYTSAVLHIAGLCKSIEDVTALRAGIKNNVPDVPTAWLSVQAQSQTYLSYYKRSAATALSANQKHLHQYEAHVRALDVDIEGCEAAVQGFAQAQSRLYQQGTSTEDTNPRVLARDQLRVRAIRGLQQMLKKAATAQQTNGESTTFSASTDQFEKAARTLLYQTTGVTVPAISPSKAQPQQACADANAAIIQWRSRHDVSVVIAATDSALDALWKALAASKGSLKSVPLSTTQAVAVALDNEHKALKDVHPMDDFPTAVLAKTAATLVRYDKTAADKLRYSNTRVQWANDQLSQLQLQAIQKEKYDSKVCKAIQNERSRLCAIASSHFPELLLPGSTWSVSVGIDLTSVTGEIARQGILAEGYKLEDFTQREVHSRAGRHVVWKVTDTTGKQWALKEFSTREEVHIRHFFRQAKLINNLKHPNVAAVHAVFQQLSTHSLYLQMPWYGGGDLKGWLEANSSSTRSLTTCKLMASDILSGVAHLHAHDSIHCDLKPGNIFLTAANRAIIGNFDGLRTATASTSTTTNHSTAAYVAPEILSGTQARFTAACDMYSCGKILKELFDGVLLDAADTTHKQILINSLIADKPEDRITAQSAWQSKFLDVQRAAHDTNKQCAVCGEVVASTKGLDCVATVGNVSHFICDEDIDGYVSACTNATSAPYLQLAQARGHLDCPCKPCTSIGCFSPQALASHVTSAVHKQYMAALNTGTEALLMPGLQRDFEKKLKSLREELMKVQANNAVDEAARQAELHITSELLTLNCPRCSTPFYDFDGCCALQCCRCETWFCGWCLTDCGNSQAAHAHVRGCAQNQANGNVYCTNIEQFHQHQTEQRQRLILEYIHTLPANIQAAVKPKINIHLRDLGIQV
eukprot:10109-Heterococcus_DN1.PRE.2